MAPQNRPTAGHGPERTLDDVLSSGDTPSHPEWTPAMPQEENRLRLARRAALVRALRQAPFPSDRAGLVRYLESHAAPAPEVDALLALPEGRWFDGPEAVGRVLGDARRPDTG
jgi:hypothetical protein